MSACRRLAAYATVTTVASRHIPSPQIPVRACHFSQFPTIPQLNVRRKIVLASRQWVIEALGETRGGSFGQDSGDADDENNKNAGECCSYAVEEVKEGSKEEEKFVSEKKTGLVEVVVAALATVVLGVGNRVLYKLALVPLKHYPFFLAQFATFGYVLVYFSILYLRYRAGKVTVQMLALPKAPFLGVGLLEALGAVCGMAAGAILSGAAIPILSQSFLVWQLLLSFIFLGRRYSLNQLLGCFLVAVGVVITVARKLCIIHPYLLAAWCISYISCTMKEVMYSFSNLKLASAVLALFIL